MVLHVVSQYIFSLNLDIVQAATGKTSQNSGRFRPLSVSKMTIAIVIALGEM